MFFIHMPKTFKVGDTADTKINGQRKQVTWRDRDTLVIEPGDVRHIQIVDSGGSLNTFGCADKAA